MQRDRGRTLPVTLNSVLPGPARSEGVEQFVEDLAKGQGADAAKFEAEFFRTARPTPLLKRFAMPQEVAAMVVYACSPWPSVTKGGGAPRGRRRGAVDHLRGNP